MREDRLKLERDYKTYVKNTTQIKKDVIRNTETFLKVLKSIQH